MLAARLRGIDYGATEMLMPRLPRFDFDKVARFV
jgi:hypothetical protein